MTNFDFFGPNSLVFTNAFFGTSGLDVMYEVTTPTSVVTRQVETGHRTTISGTGMSLNSQTGAATGTVTGMSFEDNSGNVIATLTDLNWPTQSLFNSLVEIDTTGDFSSFATLLSAAPITIDASDAVERFTMSEWWDFIAQITSRMSITGSPFSDILYSGAGNDTIVPGQNSDYDFIVGSQGNDTLDFTGASGSSFYEISYGYVPGLGNAQPSITVDIDVDQNTGTVTGPGFVDTLVNIQDAVHDAYGFYLTGTVGRDTFNFNASEGSWWNFRGGEGVDTYTIQTDVNGRLSFHRGVEDNPSQGLVVNMNTGVVSNDGYGNREQINFLGGTGRVEIRATDFGDSLTGSDARESFIGEQGNDTIDGGGGVDRVRYDRSGVGSVEVDLAAGRVTGTWDGHSFTDTLLNIENVSGSYFADTMIGSSGEDTLYGSSGNDNIVGGEGRDHLYGGTGDDTLDGSQGGGYGDYISPYTGANTIIGNAQLWMDGNGIDISYYNVNGSGGLVITQGADGSGTVTSNVLGVVNDTYTYGHVLSGTHDDDAFVGATTDSGQISLWNGQGGNDTFTGSAGIDGLFYRDDDSRDGETGVEIIFSGVGAGTAIDPHGDTDSFTGIEGAIASDFNDVVRGSSADERFVGEAGNDLLVGNGGRDTLEGGDGNDTLNGGDGDDEIIGGTSENDIRDVVYAGAGNDDIDGGYGNDELRGDAGNDTIAGGFGADTVIGGTGNDTLTGSAFADQMFGSDGDDFVNGGFGHDLLNGGAGADRFYHIGIADHGSDWVQDYDAAAGDILQFGIASATRSQFQINTTHTSTAAGERSGDDATEEAFVIYRPTGQIMWALVDGAGQSSINLQIGGEVFDLLA
ncbi:calcium-binding protein [Shimia thalassica]|uniref:calcium-binding protein n=1 Tax=Shimia thalassica TaxID=1715693 RepID=UPI0026E17696|nr:calcium-binding protein [Shimia thalassica]MDO6482677.1 calcium-binding protein [Shimia thalassica]